MSRAKTQPPVKKKRVATPPQLTPIDEADVDDAFAAIRMESEPAASPPPRVLVDVNADAAAAAAAIADLSMDDDIPVEVESGSDFAPDLSDLAEIKKADSPTRRARTQPAEAAIEEAIPAPAKKGPPKPPPGKKPEVPKPPAKIPSILSKVKAAEKATGPSTVVPPPASSVPPPASSVPPPASSPPPVATKPLLAPATGGASIGRISVGPSKPPPIDPKPADPKSLAKPNATGPATRAETVGGTQVGSNPIRPPAATILEAPATIVTPNPLESLAAIPPPLAPPPRAESVTPLPAPMVELDTDDVDAVDVVDERMRDSSPVFPRSESAVIEAQAYVESPAYVAPRRAERATSEGDYLDYGADDDAMTSADAAAKLREINQGPPRPPSEAEAPRAASYLEYAVRAGLPRKNVATDAVTALPEPPARDSEMKIEPVPTKVLEKALSFDEEKSGFDIQPVPTKILDAALRFDSESEIGPAPKASAPVEAPKPLPMPARPKAELPKPGVEKPALPKLALRVESEFDYSSLALDNDGSGRMVIEQVPRANSALERALRDSMSSIDVDAGDVEVGEESGDFGEVIAPLRTKQLAERRPSISDEDRTDEPILQLAVYENAQHLAPAAAAIVDSGHAITASTSEREGLEEIGIAMTDGHIDAILVGIPGGEVLIKAALAMAPWGPIVIASCGGNATEATRIANAAGADLVAIRPHDAYRLGPVLHAAARILEQRRDLMSAQQGREEDLLSRLGSDAEPDEVGGLLSFDAFQRALELELKRVRRYQYPLTLALFALDIESTQPSPPGIKGILRARAGNALLHSIRDIDMATELDQDRFLVLLPYTDLTGATEVARRIIRAVGAIAPVFAAGGEFQPKLIGAITGAKPGQQLSFAKLIRDAQRALEEARRDGAELAVQP